MKLTAKTYAIVKHCAAILLGLLIVDGCCAWYYNPAPYTQPEGRATDTIRTPDAWTCQAREGFGAHRIDSNGYNNPPGEGPIRVLMMGSSHTEAFNVPAGRDVSSQLAEMLGSRVYNLGTSNHKLYRNAANLERALDLYKPTDWVTIETASVVIRRHNVRGAMADTLERLPATNVPLPDFISNQPLAKRLFKQFMSLIHQDTDESEAADYDDIPDGLLEEYEASLTEWFIRLNATASRHGVRLAIWFHPQMGLDMDGNLASAAPQACLTAFRNACERAGVTFVDLTDDFLAAYASEHILPHGFANTAMGAGHLNADGHRLAAEALYRVIQEGGGAA